MLNFDSLNLILFALPVYQMMFYAIQLFTLRKKNNPSRLPLGILMLLMLIYVIINASRYLGYSDIFKYLYIIQLPVLVAIIPTYCIYFRQLSSVSGDFPSRASAWCYMPAFVLFALNIFVFAQMDSTQLETFLFTGNTLLANARNASVYAVSVFLIGNVLIVAVQLILSTIHHIRMMNGLKKVLNEDSASLPHFQDSWSGLIFLSILGFVVLNSLMNLFVSNYNTTLAAIINIGILMFSGVAGYLSFKQDKLFVDVYDVAKVKSESEVSPSSTDNTNSKSKTSQPFVISHQEAKEIVNTLLHYLVTEKPYLNSKLRIIDVARKIEVSKHKLTYVINHEMGSNFYGLINRYRVLEAKDLLKQPETQKYNIEVISEMVGFRSKSSFNGCFKEITGETPSQFRKQNGGN